MVPPGGTSGPSRSHRAFATAFAALLSASLLGALVLVSSPPVRADAVSFTLYGRAIGGWGTSPGGETNPGPTLTVTQGDEVTARLIAEDGFDHGLFIDYNGNGQIDFGTDYSGPVGLDVTSTFTIVAAPGTYAYYCSIHSGPPYNSISAMRGTWIVNGRPAATFAAPGAGTSWTGGVTRDIVFDLSDDDPLTSLTVWVNYSYSGGANRGTIAGPITGTANPNTVSWTPTGFTAPDVVIEVTAVDAEGAKGTSLSVAFEVDSTAPTIAARSPAPNAVGVNRNRQVRVTWSEPMNTAATGSPSSFAVQRVSDGAWTPGTISWAPNATQMAFSPAAPLDPLTTYEVRVNASARDDSDPGNTFAGPATWPFTTGTSADTLPPTVGSATANPESVELGNPVNLTALVTDDDAVASVAAHVTGPSTDVNLTMERGLGTTWFVEHAFTQLGAYAFTAWAEDNSGNAGSGSGTFAVQDTTAPEVAIATAVPSSAPPGGAVNLTAQITDNGALASVRAHVLGPGFDMNLTMTSAAGNAWYVNRTYNILGTYSFTVWATDGAGNLGSRTGSFSIASAPPPPAPAMVMASAQADGTILVTWSAVTAGSVAGYNVYRGTSLTGPFTKLTSTPVPATGPLEYIDRAVQPGATYHYVVTAVDAAGNESPNSSHASATVPLPAPGPDYTIWIALAVLAAAIVVAVAFVLRRRMKPKA